MLLNSFYSQILPTVTIVTLSKKIEKILEWALRLLYSDSYSSYNGLVLKAERPTMEVSCLWRLAISIFKTLKSLNPDFMHTYFYKSSHSARRKNDLVVSRGKIQRSVKRV